MQSTHTPQRSPPSLDILDIFDSAMVLDSQPSGLSGTLCIAVAKPDGARRWIAQFGHTDAFGFIDQIPQGCTTTVILKQSQVDALLAGEALDLSSGGVAIAGDVRLFDLFLRRFFSHTSSVGIRLFDAKPGGGR